MSTSLAASAVRPATRSSSCCCSATSRSYFAAASWARFLALRGDAFSRFELSFETVDHDLALRQRRVTPGQRLLERRHLLPFPARLAIGLRQHLMRLFLRFEQRFLPAGFAVALGVLDDAHGLRLGAANGLGGDALAVGDPDGKHRRRRPEGDEDIDQQYQAGQHVWR